MVGVKEDKPLMSVKAKSVAITTLEESRQRPQRLGWSGPVLLPLQQQWVEASVYVFIWGTRALFIYLYVYVI